MIHCLAACRVNRLWLSAASSRIFLAALALTVFGEAAKAQQSSRPSPVDPLQTEKRFDALQSGQRLAKPPPRLPKVPRPEVQADTRPLFTLKTVSIEGAVAISSSELEDTYRSYLARKVSKADLVAIANAISERYRSAGYHLSRAVVPPQEIENGHVRMRVVEGSITDVELTGIGADTYGAKRILNVLLQEFPARLETLERKLLLLNDTPGVRVADTAIEEIGSTTGHFRLTVKLATWRVYQNVGVDNLSTHAAGPWQAYSTTAFNSYIAPGDTLAVNLSTVPDTPKELRFGRMSYDIPIGTDGIRIGGSASYSEVWPGDERRTVETRTIYRGYDLRGSFTPLETRKSALTFAVVASLSDPYEKTTLGYNYIDHVRTISLLLDYKIQDPLEGWNYFTLAYRQGLNILGASQPDDPLISRAGAEPDFSIFSYAYTRYQKLTDSWSLRTTISGQLSSGPLLTSQAFYLGGAAFGPGYYSRDNGIAGLAELRFDQSIDDPFLKAYQPYIFVDAGKVWDDRGGPQTLVSAGGGIRLFFVNELAASLGLALPVSFSSRTEEFRQLRILFSLSKALRLCPERAQIFCL